MKIKKNFVKSSCEPSWFLMFLKELNLMVSAANSSVSHSLYPRLVLTGKPHLHLADEVRTVLEHLEHFVSRIYPHFSQTPELLNERQFGHSIANTLRQCGQTALLSGIFLWHFGQFIYKIIV